MTDLKLIAFDIDDLNIVSAHLQDAILRVGDMAFLPREQRFAAILSRFDWALSLSAHASKPDLVRCRSALRLERVTRARLSGIDLKRPDDMLVLLALSFRAAGGDDPGGTVCLTFAGNAALELDVECIEAALTDLGPVWTARAHPDHDAGTASPRHNPS